MLPLVTGSYIVHVLLHDPFIFGANQVLISTVLHCIVCSMLNCFFINGTYLTENKVYHNNGNQDLKLLAAMATGGCDRPTQSLTHSLLYVHVRRGSISSRSVSHTVTPNFLTSDY